MTRTIAAMAVGLAVLAACEATTTAATTDDIDSGLPSPAQSNCMAAVANETGEGNVTVQSAVGSDGGTEVIIGVGQERAPWRCLADRDGNVEQVISAVDERVL